MEKKVIEIDECAVGHDNDDIDDDSNNNNNKNNNNINNRKVDLKQ